MEMDPDVRAQDALHERTRGVVAEMIRAAAAAGPDGRTAELTRMVNALFGLDLTEDAVAAASGSAALASRVEAAWYESGGTAPELEQRLAALVDD
jgi:hypothetical protein